MRPIGTCNASIAHYMDILFIAVLTQLTITLNEK